jgi:hypothetical protein
MFGTLPALLTASARRSGDNDKKGNFRMFAKLSNARDTATALAGAFITALLFVSSATSQLPIA